ncbi:MAG TPA: DUF4198 domain-containing protein [Synergistales bacterium]|nr:DUF4198 domain-containing protein [Synergistales bacterium]
MEEKWMKRFFVRPALFAVLALATVATFAVSDTAWAHFQMVYTPHAIADTGQELNLKIVFTHPFTAGHTMDMGKPRAFFLEHKGKRTDLGGSLKAINWKSMTNQGVAYEAVYKVRTMGDYIFCLEPEPYLEESEDCYIQQFTKSYVNVAGMATDWDREIGLPAEIVPLDKPYALWAGSTFRGIVKSGGKIVPYADIEVEFLNHQPLTKENAFSETAEVEPPFSVMETLTIKADGNGVFVFGIPREGWWGFAALGVGPETEHKGKELSQDAVIWVYAHGMK